MRSVELRKASRKGTDKAEVVAEFDKRGPSWPGLVWLLDDSSRLEQRVSISREEREGSLIR